MLPSANALFSIPSTQQDEEPQFMNAYALLTRLGVVGLRLGGEPLRLFVMHFQQLRLLSAPGQVL